MYVSCNHCWVNIFAKKDNFHFLKSNISFLIGILLIVDKRKWAEQCLFDTCALCEIPDDIFSAAHLDDIFSELHSSMTSRPWIVPRSIACGGQGRWWHVCGEISADGATATYFDDISRLFDTWSLAWSAFGALIHCVPSLDSVLCQSPHSCDISTWCWVLTK